MTNTEILFRNAFSRKETSYFALQCIVFRILILLSSLRDSANFNIAGIWNDSVSDNLILLNG